MNQSTRFCMKKIILSSKDRPTCCLKVLADESDWALDSEFQCQYLSSWGLMDFNFHIFLTVISINAIEIWPTLWDRAANMLNITMHLKLKSNSPYPHARQLILASNFTI